MINELGDNIIPLTAIVGGLLFATVWLIVGSMVSVYKTTINNRLKQRLVERGYSANEIEKIVSSTPSCGYEVTSTPPRKPPVKTKQLV